MTVMVSKIAVTLLLIQTTLKGEETEENVNLLAELPMQELLMQRKNLERNLKAKEESPMALPLTMNRPYHRDYQSGRRRKVIPVRKTFHDDESEDEKGVHEKKEKHKIHDILNTSLTALSYLAFGGYLVCIIVNSLRERRRRIIMAYPTGTGAGNNNQMNNVFQQQFGNRRPIRFRFPAVAIQSGKKRRKRSKVQFQDEREEEYLPEPIDDFSIFNLID